MAAKKLVAPSLLVGRLFPFPQWVDAKLLSASTAESFSIPSDVEVVVITATVDSYVNMNATATVPGDTSDGSASALLPAGVPRPWAVQAGSTISVISAGAPIVTLECYKR